MQNPGSDAGVFVWAGDANIPYRTINPDAGANVTPRKTLHAPRDIPVMHTVLQIYDGVC